MLHPPPTQALAVIFIQSFTVAATPPGILLPLGGILLPLNILLLPLGILLLLVILLPVAVRVVAVFIVHVQQRENVRGFDLRVLLWRQQNRPALSVRLHRGLGQRLGRGHLALRDDASLGVDPVLLLLDLTLSLRDLGGGIDGLRGSERVGLGRVGLNVDGDGVGVGGPGLELQLLPSLGRGRVGRIAIERPSLATATARGVVAAAGERRR